MMQNSYMMQNFQVNLEQFLLNVQWNPDVPR